ncbi:MAG TPA: AraC family transcriptional regulator [Caulobacteraceae bacterium]|nr:AraC family transcriptional regulator [Caulobacteraceae bacterium]
MNTQEMRLRLAPLAVHDTRKIAYDAKFSFLSAFVARETETIQAYAMPVAGLLVVVEGVKNIFWNGRTFTYGPGMAFSLPAGACVDVVNEPDPRSGLYRALFIGFSPDLLEEARRRWSSLAAGRRSADPTVEITPALASAVIHTSEALAGVVEVSSRVTSQRIQEILLALAECGAAPMRPDLTTCSTTEAVRLTLRSAPAHRWTVGILAEALNTSEPTLRRHLRQEGASFRQLLAEERMRAARSLLLEGRTNVAEAAIIGGYASLSHFAKRFRSMYGHLPSEILAGGRLHNPI